ASTSARQSPTGPAPMTITRSVGFGMRKNVKRAVNGMRSYELACPGRAILRQSRGSRRSGTQGRTPSECCPWVPDLVSRGHAPALHSSGTRAEARLAFCHRVLHRTDPAGVGEVEHDTERVLILGLVIGLRRGRSAREVGTARFHHLLLGVVEVVNPHAV